MPLLVRGAPIIVQPVPRLFFSRRCQWRPRGRARDRWRGEVVPDVVHESVVLLNQVIFHLAWDPCHGYGALSTPVTDTDTFDSDTESQWHQRNLSKSRVKETAQGVTRRRTRSLILSAGPDISSHFANFDVVYYDFARQARTKISWTTASENAKWEKYLALVLTPWLVGESESRVVNWWLEFLSYHLFWNFR